MKISYAIIILLLSLTTFAQPIVKYYDLQWQVTSLDKARYMSAMEKRGSLWFRSDFYIPANTLQMNGSYTDTSCKVRQGKFQYFFANGHLKSTGLFNDGKKHGIWLSFYSNGMPADSVNYDNGNITGTALQWHSNGFISDSAMHNANQSGMEITWFDNGIPASAGLFGEGRKKTGKWKYFHKNGKLSDLEIYDNGTLANRQYFDENGISITDTACTDREASFVMGGKEGWKKYLEKHLYFPREYKIVNSNIATVGIEAVVDEDGKLGNIEVSVPFHPVLDKILVDALRKSSAWIPAMQYNRRVKYKIVQFVSFTQSEY